MTRPEAVALGQRLVKAEGEIRWKLGDLAVKMFPSERGANQHGGLYDRNELHRFANDIGIKPGTLEQYRWVSQGWPQWKRQPGNSWT